MKKYSKAVAENLEFMGTPVSQWQAVPIKGFEETTGENGKTISMPVFEFPKGYAPAKTLYPSESSQPCCEWCGHDIKKLFWIQNDEKKWIMSVGSECITSFGEGKSGEKISKEVLWEKNRTLLRQIEQLREILRKEFSSLFPKRINIGYGRSELYTSDRSEKGKSIRELHSCMGKIIGNLTADDDSNIEGSSNASISRWANKNRDKISKLIEQALTFLVEKEGD